MKELNIILNGQKATPGLVKSMIDGLNDKKIRTEKGGYLFKIAVDKENLYLGILPEFYQGDRNYHYNIELPGNPEYFLTGNLNPDGVFSILFIPKQKELSEESREEYRKIYICAADTLLKKGLNDPGELDMVTKMILHSSGLFDPAPETLKGLSVL